MSNLTPHQVVETLSNIGKEIDLATKTLEELDEMSVRARAKYKTQYAREFLMAEGSMDIRRFTAELRTEAVSLEADIAEQKVRATVAHLKALRDRLEIGRSLGPLVRLEWGQS